MKNTHAIVLFGHGSRDALWHLPIQSVAQRIQHRQPDVVVVCAYLELTSPSLLEATTALVEKGTTHVEILPMFLGVGRHAREDLPALVAELTEHHPNLYINVQPAVGENPVVLDLLAELALGNLHNNPANGS